MPYPFRPRWTLRPFDVLLLYEWLYGEKHVLSVSVSEEHTSVCDPSARYAPDTRRQLISPAGLFTSSRMLG